MCMEACMFTAFGIAGAIEAGKLLGGVAKAAPWVRITACTSGTQRVLQTRHRLNQFKRKAGVVVERGRHVVYCQLSREVSDARPRRRSRGGVKHGSLHLSASQIGCITHTDATSTGSRVVEDDPPDGVGFAGHQLPRHQLQDRCSPLCAPR